MAVLKSPLAADAPPLGADADGVIRVGATRVTLETVVGAYGRGESPEQIAAHFDSLRLADVYGAIFYYLSHQPEVDAYVRQRRKEGEAMRRETEGRFPQEGLQERLTARRREAP